MAKVFQTGSKEKVGVTTTHFQHSFPVSQTFSLITFCIKGKGQKFEGNEKINTFALQAEAH